VFAPWIAPFYFGSQSRNQARRNSPGRTCRSIGMDRSINGAAADGFGAKENYKLLEVFVEWTPNSRVLVRS